MEGLLSQLKSLEKELEKDVIKYERIERGAIIGIISIGIIGVYDYFSKNPQSYEAVKNYISNLF